MFELNNLISDLQAQSFWDVIVLITGIIYVWLAAKNNPLCWIFGIVSCGVLAVMTVVKYHLYADGMLNFFYVIMGIVGLYRWKYGGGKGELAISRLKHRQIIYYTIGGLFFSALLAVFLSDYTAAAATKLDAFTTVFSIIATIWLVQRKLGNWVLWVIVDILYVYLYFSRGAVLFMLLFIVYTLIAIHGFLQWRNEYKAHAQ